MAYNEGLADRIRDDFARRKILFEEKRMMGGLCFMVNDKMCVGIMKNMLMARVGQENYAGAIKKTGAKEMRFTGRASKGFLFVEPEGIDMDKDLHYWIGLCLAFNPKAKSSKKAKK